MTEESEDQCSHPDSDIIKLDGLCRNSGMRMSYCNKCGIWLCCNLDGPADNESNPTG